MRYRQKKIKLGKTKPASQLFLFSHSLHKNIDVFFSGNVVIEIELNNYDYKYHDEAKQIVDFMSLYCKRLDVKKFKYMTVVLNYKPAGLTLAELTSLYQYPIAIHGLIGYKQLASIHSAYKLLERRLNVIEEYESLSNIYVNEAKNEPINLSIRSSNSIQNHSIKIKQSILKSMSQVILVFNKKFRPVYFRK
ncbi:hypothetical protein [Polynucleobacter paneuropaeus]|uniref:hypothetical protein n=1 Tax=Polynucleobacter paneuropaeus TaxID=2527775 RepID=UPI0011B93526|nr:hypothetical protein [Polynucleobacter paneuropaeus]